MALSENRSRVVTPGDWDTLREVFLATLDLPPGARPAYLAQTCHGNLELREKVEDLLRSDAEAAERGYLEDSSLPWQILAGSADPGGDAGPRDERFPGEPRPEDPLPERIGPYPILKRYPRSGGGIVYLATDPSLDRPVALKVLPRDVARDPSELERLRNEARTLAKAAHPNIAIVHGLDEVEGSRLIVMEYVPGRTLAEELRAERLTTREVVGICLQIARALESAHSKGIVHRDLKPANIQITPEQTVKVLDFGIARSAPAAPDREPPPDGAPGVTAPAGTPGYMGPEVIRGESAAPASDVFALGCILFECLSGKVAFPGASWRERLEVNRDGRPDLRALPRRVPRALRTMVARSLSATQDERPAIAGVCRALERLQARWSPAGRRRRTAAVAAAGLLALVLSAAYLSTHVEVEASGRSVTARVPLLRVPLWRADHESMVAVLKAGPWNGTGTLVYGLDADGMDGGSLYVRDRLTGKLLWHVEPDNDALLDLFGESRAEVGSYRCKEIRFADLDGDGEDEVVGHFGNAWWFPTYVSIHHRNGSRMGRYYSWGMIYHTLIQDIDRDGKEEILLAGTNNNPAYQGATVVMLDDQFCNGASVDPIAHPGCTWPDSSRARVVFPSFEAEFMTAFEVERLVGDDLSVGWTRSGQPAITFSVLCNKATAAIITLDMNLEPVKLASDPVRLYLNDWPASLRERFLSQEYLNEWFAGHRLFGVVHQGQVEAGDVIVE